MFSTVITANTPATIQQYNRLREDARWASYLLGHEAATPNMTVVVEKGYFRNDVGTLIEFAWATATIGAVSSNPRYDLLSVDNAGTLVTTVGTAGTSPVKPSIPAWNSPVCYVYLRVGGTSIKSEDDSTNHYIIDARNIITAPAPILASTDALAEGVANLYYTTARFDARLSAKTTTDLAEWSNLYFTEPRVRSTLMTGLSLSSGVAVTSSDSLIVSVGKLQKQINDLSTSKANDSAVMHITWDETIAGNKTFNWVMTVWDGTLSDITLEIKGNTTTGMRFWTGWTVKSFIAVDFLTWALQISNNGVTNKNVDVITSGTGTLRHNGVAVAKLAANTFTGTQTLSGTGKLLVVGSNGALHSDTDANTIMLAWETSTAVWILKLGTSWAKIEGSSWTTKIDTYRPLLSVSGWIYKVEYMTAAAYTALATKNSDTLYITY